MLFADDDQESAEAARKSIVASAQRSESAKRKDATRRTSDDFPVQSFHDILQDLGTLCRNRIRIPEFDSEFDKNTLATPAATNNTSSICWALPPTNRQPFACSRTRAFKSAPDSQLSLQ
ncbi:MAG: hypothetical protein R3C28_11780 [Pirellulaceae bacterium]